ncbi:MAG: hypothetical protein NNA23_06215 [Nitrospira sp.]|nr:hypothetical protein [Nitrospira sp.]
MIADPFHYATRIVLSFHPLIVCFPSKTGILHGDVFQQEGNLFDLFASFYANSLFDPGTPITFDHYKMMSVWTNTHRHLSPLTQNKPPPPV